MTDKERITYLEAEVNTLKAELPNLEKRMKESLDGGLKSIRETFRAGLATATIVISLMMLIVTLIATYHK